MSQKNNFQCHWRNLDISNRKFVIKLNHRVICVTQIHVSKKILLALCCRAVAAFTELKVAKAWFC